MLRSFVFLVLLSLTSELFAQGAGNPQPAAVLERRPLFNEQEFQALRTREDVESLAFTADGKHLVAWTEQTVVAWDWANERPTFESKRASGSRALTAEAARLVAMKPAGAAPIGLGLGALETRSMVGGRQLKSPVVVGHTQAHGPTHAWSPDGRWLAAGYFVTNGGTPSPIHLLDARAQKARHSVTPSLAASAMPITYPHDKQRTDSIWACAFSDKSRYLAAASMGGKVTVWNVSSGKEHAVFDVGECLTDRGGLDWLGEDFVMVPANNPNGFARCDMQSKTVLPLCAKNPKASIMPRGQHNLVIWAFTPDASRLIFRRSMPGLASEHSLPLFVYDLTNGKEIGYVPTSRATRVAISPDGSHIAIGTLYSHVLVYRLEDFEAMAKAKTPLPTL